ncbi:hypothetical protein [Taibaiella chishuiensis]|uniref:Uncharacterized protein n=1 Tax=Taibaiella chishuiensis TaxID=1434707 RepID=A0A2P8CT63_9BACT|nr:hypothetical protein [Taibaiella chishuiensis]PSK88137.1 hypothetical protein B0I18_11531 [Taibaiella chishuiensis]
MTNFLKSLFYPASSRDDTAFIELEMLLSKVSRMQQNCRADLSYIISTTIAGLQDALKTPNREISFGQVLDHCFALTNQYLLSEEEREEMLYHLELAANIIDSKTIRKKILGFFYEQ